MPDKLTKSVMTALEKARIERGMSIREVAGAIGTSISQTQRILGKDKGDGSISLRTVATAAEVLGVEVSLVLIRIPTPGFSKETLKVLESFLAVLDEVRAPYTEPNEVGLICVLDRLRALATQRDEARERINDAYRMGERLRPMIEEFRELTSTDDDSDMYFEAWERMEKAADELAQIATVLLGVKS